MTHTLPPVIKSIENGRIEWGIIGGIDFVGLGLILSSHLVIEHHIDNFLKVYKGNELEWDAAKLTFSQKLALICNISLPEPYKFIPTIKHLNKVRNEFSHKLSKSLSDSDMLPFRKFIKQYAKFRNLEEYYDVIQSPADVLTTYTTIVCSYFAGYISANAHINFGKSTSGSKILKE